MKKIAFFVPSLTVGGMERVLVTYANLFARRGYDVTVFNLTSGDPAITDFFDPAVHYCERYIPVPHILHAKPKDLLRFNFRVRPFGAWIKFHSARYLAKKYLQEHFDIAVAFFGTTAMKIVSGCDDTLKIGWFHSENIEDDVELFGGIEKASLILRKFDRIFCVSGTVKDKLIRIFGEKDVWEKGVPVTINNPNDSNRIRTLAEENDSQIKKPERFTFVNVSRLDDKSKGFLRLFDACKRLTDEGYNFELWIVGDGLDRELIHKRAEELKLDNVLFWGKQSNPYKYIKKANMYLCSSYYEGFSMSLIETVILGKPILSTSTSGIGEMLEGGKYGMIVENSEEGLYMGMKTILSDETLYQHYCKMAELRKDYLSEDKIMDEVERIIYE